MNSSGQFYEGESNDGWGRSREPLVGDDNSFVAMDFDNSPTPYHEIVSKDYVLPGMDGVPLAELNQTYAKEIPSLKVTDYYTVIDNGDNKCLKFTALFTCPLTGENFASGDWGPVENIEEIEGVYWYTKKNHAKSAAAARTLDVKSLRRCQNENRKPCQRCRDKPYLLQEDAPALPDLPIDIELPVKLSQEARDQLLRPPKEALVEWYQEFGRKLQQMGGTLKIEDPDKSCYATWESPNRKFTSVFRCPMTGELFRSGRLREGNYEIDPMYFNYSQAELKFTKEDEFAECDDLCKVDFIWYSSKKEAQDAVAARAIECFHFRYTNTSSATNKNSLRYCEDEPYIANDIMKVWKDISDTVEGVIQVKFDGDGITFYFESWPKLTGEISEGDLRRVLESDEENNEGLRAYIESRGMGYLENIEEDE